LAGPRPALTIERMPDRGNTSGFRRALAGLIGRSARPEDPDAPGDPLFKAFASSSSAAVFLHRGGRLLYANRGAAALAGREVRELQGADYFTLVHPDFREGMRQRSAGDGEDVRLETLVLRGHGRRWCRPGRGGLRQPHDRPRRRGQGPVGPLDIDLADELSRGRWEWRLLESSGGGGDEP
jgi:PAS domain-containing protein